MKPELQSVLNGKKIAFISVFDKQGLEPLARALSEQYGYVILSTGNCWVAGSKACIPRYLRASWLRSMIGRT
jgi:hypothetical protein